ncbi:MAG: TadE/TadG family type IV pilus assembly protein [Acetobacteraceae bacterium]
MPRFWQTSARPWLRPRETMSRLVRVAKWLRPAQAAMDRRPVNGRNPADCVRDVKGGAVIEFALIAPVLTIIIFATAEFGINAAQYIQLTNAVAAGARQFSISRPTSTPFTSTTAAIKAAAPGLSGTSISIKLSVAGTQCTDDTTCKTKLGDNIGGQATVSATYPCNLPVIGWRSGCNFASQSSGAIQ